MHSISILAAGMALIFASNSVARSWTTPQGKTVEAVIVRIHSNQTVVLKTANGKTVTVPFDTFIEADILHLNHLLARRASGRGKPHPVSWEKMNHLLGVPLWQDDFLWDDSTAAVGQRMEMSKESKTAFMENYRAYPLGKEKILAEPVYAAALYGGKEYVESLSLVFLNQGDIPASSTRGSMSRKIEASGKQLYDTLQVALGPPKRDSLGKGDLREKVWRWDWDDHAILLSVQEGKYVALRIMPSARADRSGRVQKLTEAALQRRMASCVERRDSGDVVICNIPMVDQGPKGYCSPATWERYLRYMEIPADMYLLALAAQTGVGGGTYSHEMVQATRALISANGRELETIKVALDPKSISKYIDQGLPIMWRLTSTPDFRKAIRENTALRKGEEFNPSERDTGSGGHICLIIGYNLKTGEIAISDSWGAQYTERWVHFGEARQVSRGSMNVIKW